MTRATLLIVDQDGQRLANMYIHGDGYPQKPGLAWRIRQFFEAENRQKLQQKRPVFITGLFNEMGCLAAQIVGWIKDDHNGMYYLRPINDNQEEEYNYVLYNKSDDRNVIYLKCSISTDILFDKVIYSP